MKEEESSGKTPSYCLSIAESEVSFYSVCLGFKYYPQNNTNYQNRNRCAEINKIYKPKFLLLPYHSYCSIVVLRSNTGMGFLRVNDLQLAQNGEFNLDFGVL